MTRVNDPAAEVQTSSSFHFGWKVMLFTVSLRRDNVKDNRCAVIKLTILIPQKYGTSVHRIVIDGVFGNEIQSGR